MSIMLPCSAVTSPFRNSMIGAFRVADGPAVPPGGIVFDGDTWYVSQRDESGVDLAANLARLVAGSVVTVETPTGSSTLTITGAARAEGDHVVIVGTREREGAMIAGQETGLWLRAPLGSGGGAAPDPLDLTGEWSQWWGTTPANLAALKANPTVGDSGSIVPTGAFTTGQYVTLGDGSKASWDGAAWVAGAAA
jgi:hypothetical protein